MEQVSIKYPDYWICSTNISRRKIASYMMKSHKKGTGTEASNPTSPFRSILEITNFMIAIGLILISVSIPLDSYS